MTRIAFWMIGVAIVMCIALTPAKWLYDRFAPALPGVSLTAIEGSIWSGSGQIQVADLPMAFPEPLTWSFAPIALFSGDIAWQLSATDLNAHIRAAVPVSAALSNNPTLSSLSIDADVQELTRWMPALSAVRGHVNGKVEHIAPGACSDTQGEGVMRQSQLLGLPLGDISVTVACQGANYRIAFTNESAPIDLDGEIKLTPRGGYQLTARLQADDPELRQQLAALAGTSAENRTFTLRQNGNL
jgi:hypothetical protein